MERDNQEEQKWEGKACAKLPSTKPDQAWPLLSEFSSLHKWLPLIETCRIVDGVDGLPGCVRYCAVSSDGDEPARWAMEKLLDINQVERSLSYEVTESNMGFGRYVATFKVVPDLEGEGCGGCKLEWAFDADPVKGWTQMGFVSYLENGLQAMARRVEEALQVKT